MAQTHKQKRLSAWSTPILLIAILVVFTLLVTLLGDKSLARMAAQTLIRVTFVVGLWIFVGNSGLVSFGHAGYMAIGAYCSAWLTLRPQMKGMFLPDLWPYLATAEWHGFPAAVASGLLAAVIALISGAAILRLSGIAASIATFAFLAIVYTVYSSWEGVTGATSSVVGLTRYADQWVTLGWASVTVLAAAWYANSASGLALRASREDEVAADASGINMYGHRLISLVVSAFFAGVAGALFGHCNACRGRHWQPDRRCHGGPCSVHHHRGARADGAGHGDWRDDIGSANGCSGNHHRDHHDPGSHSTPCRSDWRA